MSLVLGLGLKHSCPWPRECLSSERLSLALASERLSLALASDFFCVLGLGLGLEPYVLDSTSDTQLSTRGGVEDTRLEAKKKSETKAKAKDSLSEDRTSRGQGQECLRPRTRPRTSKCVLNDVLEAKDVLKDSTSANHYTASPACSIAETKCRI